MHALGREMLARRLHVLGRDPDARAALHRALPVIRTLHGHHEAATTDAQVERLEQSLSAVFQQHVTAGHAHVGGAVLHIGRHIGRAHHHQRHIGSVGGKDQLARRLRILGRHDARQREQRQRFIEDAALGQGDGQRGHGGNLGGYRRKPPILLERAKLSLVAIVGQPPGYVGGANGANAVCILIPCHRVIAADGSPGGYSAGLRRKERLLALERDGVLPRE